AVGIERPGDGPFGAALVLRKVLAAGEGLVGDGGPVDKLFGQVVGEAVRELEDRGFGDVCAGPRRGAAPADLDPGEEIGLGARELIDAQGIERSIGPENLGVGDEAGAGAAAVGGRPDGLELRGGDAAREALAIEGAVARDLDHGLGRKRVDDADPDAVEAARGAIRLALELPARVERGHDDLERRLAGIFGGRLARVPRAVADDGQAIAGLERDLDAGCEAGDRLVHAIVDDLGGEVVERAGVGPADVHAGAAADRLEAFEHLDRGRVVAVGGSRGGSREQVGHWLGYRVRIRGVPRERTVEYPQLRCYNTRMNKPLK